MFVIAFQVKKVDYKPVVRYEQKPVTRTEYKTVKEPVKVPVQVTDYVSVKKVDYKTVKEPVASYGSSGSSDGGSAYGAYRK